MRALLAELYEEQKEVKALAEIEQRRPTRRSDTRGNDTSKRAPNRRERLRAENAAAEEARLRDDIALRLAETAVADRKASERKNAETRAFAAEVDAVIQHKRQMRAAETAVAAAEDAREEERRNAELRILESERRRLLLSLADELLPYLPQQVRTELAALSNNNTKAL